MKQTFHLRASVLIAAMLMVSGAHAQTLSKVDYKAGKDRISADLKADKATCAPMKANAKDACTEEAKATEKVALAELI